MLGVSMARRCPDQTQTDAARKAYVAAELYDPPSPMKPAGSGPAKSVVPDHAKGAYIQGKFNKQSNRFGNR